MRLVDKRLIDGERIVLVEDGKVRIGEDGMPVVVMDKTWEMWSVRGEGDGDKGK